MLFICYLLVISYLSVICYYYACLCIVLYLSRAARRTSKMLDAKYKPVCNNSNNNDNDNDNDNDNNDNIIIIIIITIIIIIIIIIIIARRGLTTPVSQSRQTPTTTLSRCRRTLYAQSAY